MLSCTRIKTECSLYTIYTNKISLLHKLMKQEIFHKLTNSQITPHDDIIHTTVNYVDDSTSIISSKTTTQLQTYIDNYYKLIDTYYNINFLKINPDKTKFIITCKPTQKQNTKDRMIHAGTFIIKQSDKLKILGIYLTSGLDQTPNANNLISKVNHRINILNKITKYTNIKT